MSLEHARKEIEEWRVDYNTERPHSSLGYLTPEEFLRKESEKIVRDLTIKPLTKTLLITTS